MTRHTAIEQNRRVWDEMARAHHPLARPCRDEDFADPLAAVDALGWLGAEIKGKRVLCLAAGGGRQSALFAAAGARVTVVDISPEMLDKDRFVAHARSLDIAVVETSMDDLAIFHEGEFDYVIQPVSSCYLPSILDIYREVARVTKVGGLYISQHKQPVSLQTEVKPAGDGYRIVEAYYRDKPVPVATSSRIREGGAVEYVHRWEQLIGGLCRAGFVVEDLVEPMLADNSSQRGEFGHRCQFVPPYVRIKARRVAHETLVESPKDESLWIPD